MTKQGGTTFTFVTDGIEAALEQARAAAGEKDVAVGGGANVAQQYLEAGLLGDGVRLFERRGGERAELERSRVLESPQGVTHMTFLVKR